MAENKRHIFDDVNALNMSTGDALTDRERNSLKRHVAKINKRPAKYKKSM